MQHSMTSPPQTAWRQGQDEGEPHADSAAPVDERYRALATAAVLCSAVLIAGYFLMQGARRYALAADCAIPAQLACDRLALK